MPTVLSTKKLSDNQKSLLLNAGVGFVEYNAITIEHVPFEIPKNIEKAIFTSQNSVRALMNHQLPPMESYCVGEKTKSLLEEYGQQVIKQTEYASELAAYLVENHKNDSFHFFCGNIRSDEIPSKLKQNGIHLNEIEVYKTILNPKKIERQFDAVLFYSPSGIRSYISENKIENGTAVCIGATTAAEAKKYTENVVVANNTTIESVIAKTVKILKN